MKRIFTLFILLSGLMISHLSAQTVIEVQPLFEYPSAPDEVESLEERCNYVVKNFWTNFDFKKQAPVDQYALNEAFNVYITAFQFASPKEIDQSLEKLLKNLSSNNILLMQFCKAAEENLYGPRASFWADSIYLQFLEAVIKNKKIPESRKARYITQAQAIKESKIGNTAPSFWFQDKERGSKQYFPMSTPTMLIFGDPDNTDWRLARLKMESNYQLQDALTKGKVNILFILPKSKEGWENEVSNYNTHWVVGVSEEVPLHYDLRFNPDIYIIDSSGKILGKNLVPEQAVGLLLEAVN